MIMDAMTCKVLEAKLQSKTERHFCPSGSSARCTIRSIPPGRDDRPGPGKIYLSDMATVQYMCRVFDSFLSFYMYTKNNKLLLDLKFQP